MCGIGGYAGCGSMLVLEAMTRRLAHRGPDGKGVWARDGIGLAHTRLSVLDLSAAGDQPMVSADGCCALVFNGEIYNFRELRRELQRQGRHFRSNSDTEVILQGYCCWGKDLVAKLRGMFAFAIWNGAERKLFMVRDRMGIKPLFYAQLNSGIVFASEIKALLAHPGVGCEMNPSAVDAYFELGYIPGPDTIFSGIQALPPGSWLEYIEGNLSIQRYWVPDFSQNGLSGGEDELVDQLDQRLNDAVQGHLVSDVPVGAFLSGGIDSSLICAIAQKHAQEPLHTFTVGFSGGGDERRFARLVATHIGSNHIEAVVAPDIVAELPRLVKHLEQPLFDNSVLPTHLVSQAAREHVKVVLSGDGGDEPFAGYEWTRRALSLPRAPGSWQPAGWHWAYRSGVCGLAQRLAYDLTHSADDRYQRRVCVSSGLRSWLYHPEFLTQLRGSIHDSTQMLLDQAPVADIRDKFTHADLSRYLPDDVLFKVDRMSMANSLEVRVPLLDHHLVEWVLQLPFDMRFRAGRGKYLLRKLAARYLPAEIVKARKQGFTVPIGDWLRKQPGDYVERLFHSRAFEDRRIIRKDAALQLLAMHRSGRHELGHRVWQLVMFETWAGFWIDKGDLPETISEKSQRAIEKRDYSDDPALQDSPRFGAPPVSVAE